MVEGDEKRVRGEGEQEAREREISSISSALPRTDRHHFTHLSFMPVFVRVYAA